MDARILLVEDDPLIVDALGELLAAEGFEVDACSGQDEAIERAGGGAVGAYQLVLLDIALAQGNGLAVCGAIKQARPDLPVIFLTASGDEFTTVTGFELGADDYIAKPFRPRELLARIRTAIRRAAPARGNLAWGPLRIDPDRALVTRDGAEIALSALEYRLLLLFAMHPGRVVTRDQIREALWDDAGTYIEENTLSVYIKRLRDKIEDDPAAPRLIQTVRGLGYKALG